jgi:hypothetical protein
MREAKDICYICDKVEPTPSMTYVDAEDTHDDRLVCDDCSAKLQWYGVISDRALKESEGDDNNEQQRQSEEN